MSAVLVQASSVSFILAYPSVNGLMRDMYLLVSFQVSGYLFQRALLGAQQLKDTFTDVRLEGSVVFMQAFLAHFSTLRGNSGSVLAFTPVPLDFT